MKHLKEISESKVQTKIINQLTKEGWLCVKLIKTNKNGIPDLMCLKDGDVKFIEVKQPKGIISPVQQYVIDMLRTNGFDVEIWTKFNEQY